MFPTSEGFLKLDTRLGAVSECKRVPQCWASAVQRVVASSTSSFEGVSDYGHVIAAAQGQCRNP
jgi:hypothetical protein